MKQAVKATALLLLISLLSGCSSALNPNGEPQSKTKCEKVFEVTSKLKAQIDDITDPNKTNTLSVANVRVITLSWAYSIIDNSECYEPELIAQARAVAVTFAK
jgi:hypothetical protein